MTAGKKHPELLVQKYTLAISIKLRLSSKISVHYVVTRKKGRVLLYFTKSITKARPSPFFFQHEVKTVVIFN